jgi:hypothetical protein
MGYPENQCVAQWYADPYAVPYQPWEPNRGKGKGKGKGGGGYNVPQVREDSPIKAKGREINNGMEKGREPDPRIPTEFPDQGPEVEIPM